MGMSWAEVDGTIYGNPELSLDARTTAAKQCKLDELVTPAEDFALGKKSGDSVGYRLFSDITTSATTALGEYQKVPMADVPEYTGTVSVYRRGIAVPWTGFREDLDRIDVESVVVKALAKHSGRTHNSLIATEFIAGRSFTYVAQTASTQTLATDGTVAQTAGANFSAYHARRIANYLTVYNVPPADGDGGYIAAVSPTMFMNLYDDVGVNGFVDVKKYAPGGADGALKGEKGSYMGIRFIVDNSGDISNAIGTASAFGSGFICGADAIKETVVYPMQLLANTNLGGDFGQQKAIAWLSLLAYKTVWNYTSHTQGTTLHYTSA